MQCEMFNFASFLLNNIIEQKVQPFDGLSVVSLVKELHGNFPQKRQQR